MMNPDRVGGVFPCCSDRYVCVAISAAYRRGVEDSGGGATTSPPERWIHEQQAMVPKPSVATGGCAVTSSAGQEQGALALVESPAQLLNVIELGQHEDDLAGLKIAVLAPAAGLTRTQLRSMMALARNAGHTVSWNEPRLGGMAVARTVRALAGELSGVQRLIVGDPYSGVSQVIISVTKLSEVTIVDDGTATLEFARQWVAGEHIARWHEVATPGQRRQIAQLARDQISGTCTPPPLAGFGLPAAVVHVCASGPSAGPYYPQRLLLGSRTAPGSAADAGGRPGWHLAGRIGCREGGLLSRRGGPLDHALRRGPLLRAPQGSGLEARLDRTNWDQGRPTGAAAGDHRPPWAYRPHGHQFSLNRCAHTAHSPGWLGRGGRGLRYPQGVVPVEGPAAR